MCVPGGVIAERDSETVNPACMLTPSTFGNVIHPKLLCERTRARAGRGERNAIEQVE